MSEPGSGGECKLRSINVRQRKSVMMFSALVGGAVRKNSHDACVRRTHGVNMNTHSHDNDGETALFRVHDDDDGGGIFACLERVLTATRLVGDCGQSWERIGH